MSLPTIIEAKAGEGHEIRLVFSDGRQGRVDFAPLIGTALPPMFVRLADPARFAEFSLSEGTLHWPGDLDLAPEYLYFRAFAHEPGLQRQFADWGYLEPSLTHA